MKPDRLNDSSSVRISNDYTHILATEHTSNLMVDYIKTLEEREMETGIKGREEEYLLLMQLNMVCNQSFILALVNGRTGVRIFSQDILNWVRESKKFDMKPVSGLNRQMYFMICLLRIFTIRRMILIAILICIQTSNFV